MSLVVDHRSDGSFALFIDGDLQFDSRDERIYHECLVLPALALAKVRKESPLRALIIGGGDGLAARELLKSPSVEHIDLVDYDDRVIALGRKDFAQLNQQSLLNSRLLVHVDNAWNFVNRALDNEPYDLIISDLTVPQDTASARFHSIEWYTLLRRLLSKTGILSCNTVSPSATPAAFWSIVNCLLLSELQPRPYRIALPSFTAQGYGYDWGFILASPSNIGADELNDRLVLDQPREALRDALHLQKLFHFPEELLQYQAAGAPTHDGSSAFAHFVNNPVSPAFRRQDDWCTLTHDFDLACVPPAECGSTILPPSVRSALGQTCCTPEEEEILLETILRLMPSLHRHQTRQMVSEFVRNPGTFLETLDLPGLVDCLLQRAAELPVRLTEELTLLRERLVDWAGDYQALLNLGSRILTIVTLVVIIGNLVYPDAAYGKGPHGGGGDHGGGGHDHDGGRGGRGWDHGGRGWDHGFDHHYDHWGHWGRWGGWGGRWGGYWGGWARPWHNWYWGGWGGWSVPVYAGGGGFLNFNFNSTNNNNSNSIDSTGQTYPAQTYNYTNNIQNYNWPGPNDGPPPNTTPPGPPDGGMAQGGPPDQSLQDNADYRLGPGADIIAGGRVVIQLTDGAYLMVLPNQTQVVDQSSGRPIMSLANDPSLLYHISSEINRQSLGLQSSVQSQQSANDWSGSAGFNQDQAQQNPIPNLQGAISLLNQAAQSLGPVPQSPPGQPQLPVPGAMEVFASVWLTADGNFLVIQRPDGSLAYLNSKGWYSDPGTTPLPQPYPSKFRDVVVAYLNGMVKDGTNQTQRLQQMRQEAQQRLQSLNQEVKPPQPGNTSGLPGAQVNVADGEGFAQGEPGRRVQQALRRTQRRLDMIQRQLGSITTDTAIANKFLTQFPQS